MFSALPRQSSQNIISFDFLLHDILCAKVPPSDVTDLCKELTEIEILTLLDEISQELHAVGLECFLLEDFLKNNDPKLLLGLSEQIDQDLKIKEKAETEFKKKISFVDENVQKYESKELSGQKSHINKSKSIISVVTTLGRDFKSRDYKLNYRTKFDLSLKLAQRITNHTKDLERTGCLELLTINATIEEKKFAIFEAKEFLESFDRNIVSLGLDPATGLISSEKFLKFCKSYLHNEMGLCAKMRITSNNISQEIHARKIQVASAKEMKDLITTTDFEILNIRKENQTKMCEEKADFVEHSRMLVTKLAYDCTVQRKQLVAKEKDYKILVHKVADARKLLARKQNELDLIETEVKACTENLRSLEDLCINSASPSIQDYIDLNQVLSSLAREKKMLKQKIHINNIHLANAKRKYYAKKRM